jgi:hypothetical protein
MSAPVWQLECVEAHAEGKPGRIVINAGGLVSGETMRERFQYCVDYLDPSAGQSCTSHVATLAFARCSSFPQ